MSLTMLGKLLNSNISLSYGCSHFFHTSAVVLAARKGTREKARKKKVKVEIKKIGFIPHNLRNLDKLRALKKSSRSTDIHVEEPVDQVFATRYYKTITYPIAEAIQFHRESNHPTIRNKPAAPINVTIELNMVAEKKTRFLDNFTRIATIPHPFSSYEERTVLAFCKSTEMIDEAMEAGANLAGGTELIQRIQTGDLSLTDFRFIICHPSMLPELVPIRGLLKRKFPAAKNGTLGPDLPLMLKKFKRGLQYACVKDPDEHDLGIITAQIGFLDMKENELEENFAALVADVEAVRPKRGGDFITWVWCHAEPSTEKFKISYQHYLDSAKKEN